MKTTPSFRPPESDAARSHTSSDGGNGRTRTDFGDACCSAGVRGGGVQAGRAGVARSPACARVSAKHRRGRWPRMSRRVNFRIGVHIWNRSHVAWRMNLRKMHDMKNRRCGGVFFAFYEFGMCGLGRNICAGKMGDLRLF